MHPSEDDNNDDNNVNSDLLVDVVEWEVALSSCRRLKVSCLIVSSFLDLRVMYSFVNSSRAMLAFSDVICSFRNLIEKSLWQR